MSVSLTMEKFFRKKKGALLLAGLVCFALTFMVEPAFANGDSKKGMDWLAMSMRLFGGLAIFLFGMEMMSEALRKVAGDKMRECGYLGTLHRLPGRPGCLDLACGRSLFIWIRADCR